MVKQRGEGVQVVVDVEAEVITTVRAGALRRVPAYEARKL